MEIFCSDMSLNTYPKYLNPAFAYGGSCLPKDLQSLCSLGMTKLLELPLLNSVKRSNQVIIDSAKLLINRTGCNTLCFLGMTF